MWGWWRPPCLLRPVIVNLKDDPTSVQGVLWQARGPWLTLRAAAILRAGAEPVAVDGEVIVHRDNVAFIQVLP
jgi:hypothetical protein